MKLPIIDLNKPEVNSGFVFEPTEQKPEVSDQPIDQPTGPAPNNDDFSPEEEISENAEELKEALEQSRRQLLDKASSGAKSAILLLDTLNQLALPWLYGNACFQKDERQKAKALYEQYNAASEIDSDASFSVQEIKLINKYKDYQTLIKGIKFSAAEQKHLTEALRDVFVQYNVDFGPVYTLLTVAFAIQGPRLIPLINYIKV